MLKTVTVVAFTLLFATQTVHADSQYFSRIQKIPDTSAEVMVVRAESGKMAVVMCMIPQMLQSYMGHTLLDIETKDGDIIFVNREYGKNGISNSSEVTRTSMAIIKGCATQLSN